MLALLVMLVTLARLAKQNRAKAKTKGEAMNGRTEVPAKRSVLDRLNDLQRDHREGVRAIGEDSGILVMEGHAIAERLCEPVFEYLTTLTHSDNTRAAYERCIRTFLEWLERSPAMPLRSVVAEFKRHLEGENRKPRTIALYLASLRGFFRWASNAYPGHIPNLAESIKCRVPADRVRHPLTEGEVGVLLRSIKRDSLEGLRDYAVIRLFLSTGIRRAAVLNANIEDYTERQGQPVIMFQPKGHVAKDDFKQLVPEVREAIEAWLEARASIQEYAPGDPLFVSLSNNSRYRRLSPMGLTRIVKARLEAIGLDPERYCLHSLRHTAGTMLCHHTNGNVLKVKELLGHRSIQTTMNYIEESDRLGPDAPEHILGRVLNYSAGSPLTDQEWTLMYSRMTGGESSEHASA